MSGTFHKHQRIASALAREIRSGRLPAGAKLPGEHALTRRFGTSRTTVRQALGALADQGLIATRAGLGSFVTFDGTPLDSRLGWTEALAESGTRLSTEVLRLEHVLDAPLAERIDAPHPDFLALDRLRRLPDGRAVSLETSRVPLRPALADVPERGLLDGSLTATLDDAGIVAASGEEWAQVVPLPEEHAELLGERPGRIFLRLRRLTRDRTGAPVEHVVSLLDPERFQLHLEFGDTAARTAPGTAEPTDERSTP